MGSAAGLPSSITPCPGTRAPAVSAPPSKVRTRAATAAAGSAYWRRLRTTPPMGAPWLVAEAIVVSDTGETLSPKVAPARMAPMRTTGLASRTPAAG